MKSKSLRKSIGLYTLNSYISNSKGWGFLSGDLFRNSSLLFSEGVFGGV